MLTTILLIVGGIIISLVVGTFWHMPGTPGGNLHMRVIGFDALSPEEQQQKMEEGKKSMPKTFLGQALLSALLSFSVVFIMQMSMQNGLAGSYALGFLLFNWLCFMVPVIGSNLLWGNYDRALVWKKFFSDSLYNLVTILLIAGMVLVFV